MLSTIYTINFFTVSRLNKAKTL